MSSIIIKHLSGFPIYTYEESFNLNEVVKVGFESLNSDTAKMWGHVYDDLKENRTIQRIGYNLFEISEILGANIDINELTGANHVEVVTSNYGTFYATNIEIEQNTTASRDIKYTIKFKQQLSIKYELTSDFAESLHSNLPVNVINFKINNAPYVFNNINISNVAGAKALFQVAFNNLTDTINVDDIFYLHTDNITFSQLEDDNSEYLNYAKCLSKDSDFVYFECSNDVLTLANSNDIVNLEINSISTHPYVPIGITINEKEIELNIYTFINSIIAPFNEVKETIEKGDYEDLTGKSINSKIVSTKIWLTDNDLYKATYLRYANEITYTETNGNVIVPISKTNVITTEAKETLINIHEFNIDFEIEYNTFCNLNGNMY